MSIGDSWSEPARCHKCGQDRSTHDDGECGGVQRSMEQAALKIQPRTISVADRLYEASLYCRRQNMGEKEWGLLGNVLGEIEELVALEAWKAAHPSKGGRP